MPDRMPDHGSPVVGIVMLSVVLALVTVAWSYLPSGQTTPFDSRLGFLIVVGGLIFSLVTYAWFYWPRRR